ncbi:MAG: hypothetical protein ACK56I_09720, partial [bacterium]
MHGALPRAAHARARVADLVHGARVARRARARHRERRALGRALGEGLAGARVARVRASVGQGVRRGVDRIVDGGGLATRHDAQTHPETRDEHGDEDTTHGTTSET